MHELPVTESILSIALKHAQAAGAQRVTDIHIVLGKFSSIVDDSVQFYWDLISAGTICEGARLHFQRLTPRMQCQDCIMSSRLMTSFIPVPTAIVST